eukprot:6479076-Amphidinium_carterae.2
MSQRLARKKGHYRTESTDILAKSPSQTMLKWCFCDQAKPFQVWDVSPNSILLRQSLRCQTRVVQDGVLVASTFSHPRNPSHTHTHFSVSDHAYDVKRTCFMTAFLEFHVMTIAHVQHSQCQCHFGLASSSGRSMFLRGSGSS